MSFYKILQGGELQHNSATVGRQGVLLSGISIRRPEVTLGL